MGKITIHEIAENLKGLEYEDWDLDVMTEFQDYDFYNLLLSVNHPDAPSICVVLNEEDNQIIDAWVIGD